MLFAISDIHLSLTENEDRRRPMYVFDEKWRDHHLKLQENWSKTVTEDDLVLLVGDVSWAKEMEDFVPDGLFLRSLPGRKIITRGNHDYYLKRKAKMSQMFPDLPILKNNSVRLNDNGLFLCSIKGSVCPNDIRFSSEDKRIYKKESLRIVSVLDSAVKHGATEIILAIHYPITNDKGESSAFLEAVLKYPVTEVIFGHLHGEDSQGINRPMPEGIKFHLVSADYLDFCPKPIREL